MFTDKQYFPNVLGLGSTLAYESVTTDRKQTPAMLYKVTKRGDHTPTLNGTQSLYVYSDIVKPQRVGDTEAPLLDVVPVQGSPGQRMYWSCNPPTFLPVTRTRIDNIRVLICDGRGERIRFVGIENVVCRITFRRRKRSAFLL